MNNKPLGLSNVILDSLNDGVYVCDTERRILYWSKAAERITGWTAADVVGRKCSDGILCHIDKDGHPLCGEEFCPLHRSMVTNQSSRSPALVFGQTKGGGRVPMVVSVAPIHDDDGQVIGGVETFGDFTESFGNLERAKQIQTLLLEGDLPQDPRVRFATHYVPHDIVGGDYYALRPIDAHRYGFFIADVMGHGVAAALYTMHLSSLWNRYWELLATPADFAQRVNDDLCQVVRDESFATALCGLIDVNAKTLRLASAGGPPMVRWRSDGSVEQIVAPGLPFGMVSGVDYAEVTVACAAGDALLLFTDGAVEIHDADGRMLGTTGLIELLQARGYPREALQIDALQESLLRFSNGIRLADDLTLIEVRFTDNPLTSSGT